MCPSRPVGRESVEEVPSTLRRASGDRRRLDGSRRGSVWRPPRWADGRLISPLDDGISKWVKIIVGCSAAAGFWLHGQVGVPTSATVPHGRLVLWLLTVASVCLVLVSHARFRALVACEWPSVAPEEETSYAAVRSPRWWRAAQWPDGRYVGGGDLVATIAAVSGLALLIAAVWLSGQMSVPDFGLAYTWRHVGTLLYLPLGVMGFVSSRRSMALAESDAAGGGPTSTRVMADSGAG